MASATLRSQADRGNREVEIEKRIDVGFKIGKLTVVEATNERKNGYTIWRCHCECGNDIFLDTRCLKRGTVTDCGCATKVHPGQKDLTGLRFGNLVCLEPTEERTKNGSTIWRCRCDCGNECLAVSSQLLKGYKKSCGCVSHPPLKDFIGKHFGKLQVISYEGKVGGMHRWRCKCDCGKETVVGQTLLQSGKTKSCGCIQSTIIRDNLKLVDGTSVTILEAGKNRRIKSNTSGYTGVYFNKSSQKWIAQITFQRKTYYLGSYTNIVDAIEAREEGEKLHDNFLEWYYHENMSKMN